MLVRPLHLGLAGCLVSACSTTPTTTPPSETTATETPAPSPAVAQAPAPPPGPTEFVQLRLGIAELGSIFAGIEKTSRHWSPDNSLDLTGQMQASLLSLGFGPGFYESFDLSGRVAVDVRYPHSTSGSPNPADIGLAATVPTIDARRLVQGMPPAYQPQPLSEGMWQLIESDFQLLMREQPRALELAAQEADFLLASQLTAQPSAGRRIRVEASNLPKDELDVASLLGLSLNEPSAKMLASVLGELTAMELELELGDDRDVELTLGATAPFSRLGLDTLGAPRTQPSPLAAGLPSGAVAALELSWGDPTLLLTTVDQRVPLAQIPAPFHDIAAAAVQSLKAVLGSIHDEVIFALYVSDKGEGSIVLAAKSPDETATRDAVRALLGSAQSALQAHIALVGQDPEQRYKVTYKTDALRVGKHRADQFTATVPKAMQAQIEDLAVFFGKKPKLEIVSLAAANTAVVAIGAGAKRVVGDIGRSLGATRRTNLEADGGLALARRTTAGCQVCVAVDPVAALTTRLHYLEARASDKERAAALRALRKVRTLGQIGLATLLQPDHGRLGLAAPQSLLFADANATKVVRDAFQMAAESTSAPTAVADGG
ncbi:MAG: hypothetical protein B7733_00625 [Myxococcales bacterium FL481]|nr:MAG: hypothetical protein B7733_00625 [Myxococcales bacterium FL481]